MKKIKREELLRKLNAITPGLSAKENIEQSSCFVFKDDKIYTYNEEVFCSIDFESGLEGAVISKTLLDLLGKLSEEDIGISSTGSSLKIKGKAKQAHITLANEILLPIDTVTLPSEKEWKDLPDAFSDAVSIVAECAGTKKQEFLLTCVHITPKAIEACDNFQMACYSIKTPIKENTLIRRDSIKHIVGLGINKIAETEGFVHFRNGDGLTISCRRYMDEFYDLSAAMQVDGEEIELPKGISDAAEKASLFTEGAEDQNVSVKLEKDKVTIVGQGTIGKYEERRKVKYSGEPIEFKIAPKVLTNIVKRFDKYVLGEKSILVEGPSFVYVTCLAVS